MVNEDFVYPKLSYKIIGILYNVCNEVGVGHKEQYYQNAIAVALRKAGIKFTEQVYVSLEYQGEKIGKYYLDFLIEGKIILEIKKGSVFHRKNIDQVYSYLKAKNLKLGIIANFTKSGVRVKRVVNIR